MMTWKPQLRMFFADRGVSGGAVEKKNFHEEGRRAGWLNLEESSNPYPADSAARAQWSEGYLDGICASI